MDQSNEEQQMFIWDDGGDHSPEEMDLPYISKPNAEFQLKMMPDCHLIAFDLEIPTKARIQGSEVGAKARRPKVQADYKCANH